MDAGADAYDVFVSGATPGGIACAVRAAREGLRVLLTTHESFLGGLMSAGLQCMDTLYPGPRAPIYDELCAALRAHYARGCGEGSADYRLFAEHLQFESRVAGRIVAALVAAAANVGVLAGVYPVAVERSGRRLRAVRLRRVDGPGERRVAAEAFVDASYEGDLAALAGVPYRVGREGRDAFGEPHAGRIFTRPQFGAFPSVAREGRLNLMTFGLTAEAVLAGSTGEGDGRVQSYNYRFALTREPGNRRPIERPPGYDRERYAAIVRPDAETADERHLVKGEFLFTDVAGLSFERLRRLPGKKVMWNRGQRPGSDDEYPTATRERRRELERLHLEHDLGLLWFLQHDPAVPEAVRADTARWGLAADEYPEHDNLPPALYVREARRIVGRYTFTEHDGSLAPGTGRAPVHADAVAFAEWPMDSHECSPERQLGSACEGYFFLGEATRPSHVPYRCLLPQDLDNLLVPGCLSSTHVGWGTLRLEPVWMHVGEVAGFALALARRAGVAPANVPVFRLQRYVLARGVRLSFFNDWDTAPGQPWDAAVQLLSTRGFFPAYDARAAAPLTRPVAAAWAETLAQLVAGACDVQSRARAHAAAEAADASPEGWTGLARLLAAAGGGPPPASPAGAPLTRGAAAVALDAVLRAAEAPEA